jgi:hypothetical protein
MQIAATMIERGAKVRRIFVQPITRRRSSTLIETLRDTMLVHAFAASADERARFFASTQNGKQ